MRAAGSEDGPATVATGEHAPKRPETAFTSPGGHVEQQQWTNIARDKPERSQYEECGKHDAASANGQHDERREAQDSWM